jgi:hypothetical protein
MANDQLRTWVYTLLTVVAVAGVAARICNAELVYEPSLHRNAEESFPPAPQRVWPARRPAAMPTFSSNDRSRWATVRALVDDGTTMIGHGEFDRDLGKWRGGPGVESGIVAEDGWGTIDKMMNPDTGEIFSTKPPLLTFVAAAEYWVLKHLLGWSITQDTNLVIRTILLTLNAGSLAVYLILLRRLVERLGTTDWGRLFTFTAACFATFMTTFSVTLNNHTLAAVAAVAAIYPVLARDEGERLSGGAMMGAGFFAGLTVCLELPAAAFAGLLFVVMLWREPRLTLTHGLPAAILPIGVEFGLNFAAIGQWLPAYAKVGGPWYQYPGSHWLPPAAGQIKHGIDWARMHESIYAYWFHCLIGHHGLFSLTPIWLLAFAGMFMKLRTGRPRFFAPLVLLTSIIVIGFYLVKSDNYGGWTSGLRWLIWLTPLWLLTMLPMMDRLAQSMWGRRLAYLLLAMSVFSAAYPAWNPWRHPWLYRLLESYGWISY